MSLFVEVFSTEKGCPVLINLEEIVEIAPLASGGCALFMTDSAGMNSRSALKVTNSYEMFKQFAITPVTAEDIARRFPKANKETKKEDELEIPVLNKKK